MQTDDKPGSRVSVLVAAVWLLCLAMGSVLPAHGQEAKAEDAEDAGWELVFTDTFDRDELGEDWKVVDGAWELKDGQLVGTGTVMTTRGFPGPELHRQIPGGAPPGYIRLEFEARTDVQGLQLLPGSAPPKVSVSDLSAFIHVPPYDPDELPIETGYFFQFGGFLNTRNILKRKNRLLVEQEEPEILITPNKLHTIVVENDEGVLRLSVDGKVVMEKEESASIMGDDFDRVGLYVYTNTRIERVRVFVKRLSESYR